MISTSDYELFQQLLQQAGEQEDLEVAESRMSDPQQKTVSFEEFFGDLEG